MQHKFNFTAVNFSLCDVLQNDRLFNDILTLLSRDFTQTLLIMLRENRAQQIDISI